ncbi:MAG: flagellar biosynthesis anti-sigma factor FlgM [Alkalispirochaeta sp.]
MTIERLGPVDPIQQYNKSDKINKPQKSQSADSISVSDEAKLRSELMQAIEQVREMPEIRQDRVDEVRAKLQDPSYIDDRLLDEVADEILSSFGLG